MHRLGLFLRQRLDAQIGEIEPFIQTVLVAVAREGDGSGTIGSDCGQFVQHGLCSSLFRFLKIKGSYILNVVKNYFRGDATFSQTRIKLMNKIRTFLDVPLPDDSAAPTFATIMNCLLCG